MQRKGNRGKKAIASNEDERWAPTWDFRETAQALRWQHGPPSVENLDGFYQVKAVSHQAVEQQLKRILRKLWRTTLPRYKNMLESNGKNGRTYFNDDVQKAPKARRRVGRPKGWRRRFLLETEPPPIDQPSVEFDFDAASQCTTSRIGCG